MPCGCSMYLTDPAITAVEAWIRTLDLPASIPNREKEAVNAQGTMDTGKAPLRVSYRIEPSPLQPTSPAQCLRSSQVHNQEAALVEREAMSPLSFREPSIPDNIFESGSGASLLPACGLPPPKGRHGAAQDVSLRLGSYFGTASPALSLEGSLPLPSSSPDEFTRHLQREVPDSPCSPIVAGGAGWRDAQWMLDVGRHIGGGTCSSKTQTAEAQPGGYGW